MKFAFAIACTVLPLAAIAVSVPVAVRDARVLPDDGVYPTIKLARMNNDFLAFNEQTKKQTGSFKFGENVEMPVNVMADAKVVSAGSAVREAGSKYNVHRLAVESENAFTLNLVFEKFYLPAGAEMFITGEKEVFGPVTSQSNQASGAYATWPMDGSRLIVEVWVPESVSELPVIQLESVVHGFRVAGGSSGSCNIDVACPESKGWDKEVRSAAMILTGGGSRFCSGSMINNAKNDGRQLFLTANHCVSGSWSNNMLMFNYQRPGCNSRSDGPTKDTVLGLTLLSRYAPSDFALFEVNGKIDEKYNVYLSGYNAGETASPTAAGIHHPSGDVKKFSTFKGPLATSCWSSGRCEFADHWKINGWTAGTTEPGSSGSPLFNQDHQIIGQLHGGTASCYNRNGYDVYGALFASWKGGSSSTSELARYLDPTGENNKSVQGTELNTARANSNDLFVIQSYEK